MIPKIRIEIPQDIAAQVLFESDRTCCVCRITKKPIQIHHMDNNPANSKNGNLAILCFDCHRDTQLRGGFDRKLDNAQILLYKEDWLKIVAIKRYNGRNPVSYERPDDNKGQVLRYLQVSEDSDEHLYSFDANYPQIASGDPSADEETNLCISYFITRTLQRFRSHSISGSKEKNEKKKAGIVTAYDSLSISYNISLVTPELLSIEFQLVDYHAMAVHPNSSTYTMNFRLHPSMKIGLDDLFISNNYLDLLSNYCVTDLHKQQPLRWGDPAERIEQLKNGQDHWILSGAGPEYSNYKKYVLMKGGIRVFFDPYQVGSYAEGRYEVFIPMYVLEPVLEESLKNLLS